MTAVAGARPLLDGYHRADGQCIRISARQGSLFAKQVAGDFNPIHDEDSKRFCVPGDLLFALALSRYGVRERMDFSFAGMVGDGVPLCFPEIVEGDGAVTNDQGKALLNMHFAGSARGERDFCEALIATLIFRAPRLVLRDARLEVLGKRGDVRLHFDIEGDNGKVGEGTKKLAIGGLQPYDEARMTALVDAFLARKAGWTAY